MLKSGHVQPLWAGHPWVFPQGIAKSFGKLERGDEVEVQDAQGHFIGRGLYSENSAIAVRLFSREKEDRLNRDLIEARLRQALAVRQACSVVSPAPKATDSFRVLHGEGDNLPGLVVDKFGDVLVMQLGTAGMARRREAILDALENALGQSDSP